MVHRTESYDDMGPITEDPRWNVFSLFQDYLLGAFPLVHSSLRLSRVNTYGLIYVWVGSNSTLKPILLAGHQDVVPVDPTTIQQWEHPPYSGYYDGHNVWGRGSRDDKSGLIGILSSIESLLEIGFQPKRTVVLAFGFDEEVGGQQGARELSRALEVVYGKDAFAFILDEGGGFAQRYGSVFATPGIAEKGYLDVLVEVTSPGGHSSVPPKHTSIGILSALLVKLESNPHKVHLTRDDPLYSTMQCVGEHGADVPRGLRKTIENSRHSKKALRSLEEALFKDPVYRSLVGTTQAIDLVRGGAKVNALPETAWAVVNHRISVISSVNETKTHVTKLLKPLAKSFNLTYHAFDAPSSDKDAPSKGTLTLSDFNAAHGPAPVTPTTGKKAAPYQLLAGTIKATYKSHRALQAQASHDIVVSPGMPSGSTDTLHYWDLSKHIFRYNHQNTGNATNRVAGVHGINEFIAVDSFLEIVQFFTTLILNADESRSI